VRLRSLKQLLIIIVCSGKMEFKVTKSSITQIRWWNPNVKGRVPGICERLDNPGDARIASVF